SVVPLSAATQSALHLFLQGISDRINRPRLRVLVSLFFQSASRSTPAALVLGRGPLWGDRRHDQSDDPRGFSNRGVAAVNCRTEVQRTWRSTEALAACSHRRGTSDRRFRLVG